MSHAASPRSELLSVVLVTSTVVERVGSSASLYGSCGAGHVCVLVKAVDGAFSVDAKGSDASFVGAIMEELKPLLA